MTTWTSWRRHLENAFYRRAWRRAFLICMVTFSLFHYYFTAILCDRVYRGCSTLPFASHRGGYIICPLGRSPEFCGPTLTRQPSIASIIRPMMAPSPDMWTVLFRTDGSGDKLPSGKMGQEPKQVLVTVSGAASTFILARHLCGGDGDVGDFACLEQSTLGPD